MSEKKQMMLRLGEVGSFQSFAVSMPTKIWWDNKLALLKAYLLDLGLHYLSAQALTVIFPLIWPSHWSDLPEGLKYFPADWIQIGAEMYSPSSLHKVCWTTATNFFLLPGELQILCFWSLLGWEESTQKKRRAWPIFMPFSCGADVQLD